MPADGKINSELAAIRERVQAATPAPWGTAEDKDSWHLSGDLDSGFRPPCLIEAPKYSGYGPSYWPNEADAAFIVAARTDVPRLLAAVDEVLALADKWTGDAGNQLVIVYNDPAMNEAAAAVSHKSASVRRTLAAEVRSAVLAALTGEKGEGA